jgi:hypothetical protein
MLSDRSRRSRTNERPTVLPIEPTCPTSVDGAPVLGGGEADDGHVAITGLARDRNSSARGLTQQMR